MKQTYPGSRGLAKTGSFYERARRSADGMASLAPGLLLASVIAGAAVLASLTPAFSMLSPMILAIVLGMVLRNTAGAPVRAAPGLAFALRRVLRFAIILLGFQLTAGQLVATGWHGLAIIALSLVATFVITIRLGRLMGVDAKLAELIAAGTSICGASAVMAANTSTNAGEEDVAYAVACVTLFGSAAMFAYPLLAGPLGLEPRIFGLWAGASIHEIAQVVAAAFQNGQAAGEAGVVAKLARVIMLAPLIITLGHLAARRNRRSAGAEQPAVPMPWFVLGFLAVVALNSVVTLPEAVRGGIATGTVFLLSVSLAAMGLGTDIAKLRAKGLRPLMLALAASLFIASFSLLLLEAGF